VRWTGDYPGWDAAVAASDGYAAPHILERVRSAVQAVRAGTALYERDGTIFAEPPPSWPVLDELLALAERQGGRLTVLDVGGGLGGSYFNYRHVWAEVPQLTWRVVEQPAFAAAGRREFADGRLDFFDSVAAAQAAGPADVLLLGSVLPYVPAPHALLGELLAKPWQLVVIERTGLVPGARDRLTVQRVPERLGGGSYPCWFLSRERLLATFAAGYELRRDEIAFDGATAGVEFRDCWFGRKELAAP
jgi:putative methyltransferase (TIGR04325 family)